MKFNQKLNRLPVSRRRVFNAMNVAINNNFERIASPQLEKGQYKVKKINGFTKPKPKANEFFRVVEPDPEINPGGLPEVTCDFYAPSPGVPPIFEEPNNSDTNKPAGAGWQQKAACFLGMCIVVDESGAITHSASSGNSTNSLNLVTLLQNSGKAPTTAGNYAFVFEFFGWRRDKSKLPPDDPSYYGGGWLSDDSKYKIFNAGTDPFHN